MISHLLSAFNETAWMMTPEKLDAFARVVEMYSMQRGSIDYQALLQSPGSNKDFGVEMRGSIAMLPIHGELMPKATNLDAMSGIQSTLQLHDKFLELSNSPDVEKIVLEFDSPGGAVTGIPEFAQAIHDSPKETIAFTQTVMGSAAYLLASGANKIVAAPTAVVGSIGVLMHIMKIRDSNVDHHIFQAGDKKTFGSPVIPLTQEEQAHFQQKVEVLFADMVDMISEFRNWPVAEIVATQAGHDQARFAPHFVDEILTKEQFLKEI